MTKFVVLIALLGAAAVNGLSSKIHAALLNGDHAD